MTALRHLPALLAVLAVTFGASGVSRAAAVICIGSDHLAVEGTGEDHCHEDRGGTHVVVDADYPGCVDVAILPVDLHTSNPGDGVSPPLVGCVMKFTGGYAPPHPPTAFEVLAPRPPPWLNVVSGIVLRV